ncbi:hypothetical protein FPV67DRAFT_639524 [Lyophyllum atratum]|nr:hypothetical protein FPV67DRAFT_639524 [Lyophyllum atratum]
MRFSTTLVSGLIYVSLGFSIAKGANLEYSLERRCASNGSFCGVSGGGVACCAGLFCSTSNVCRSCVTNGGFCGVSGGGVPCCSGLFCSTSNVCRSCVTSGGFCGVSGGGVPCCAGLTCTTFGVSLRSVSRRYWVFYDALCLDLRIKKNIRIGYVELLIGSRDPFLWTCDTL